MIDVRRERPEDAEAIYRLNAAAFESELEAGLVDRLRAMGVLTLSLVAVEDEQIVGHIIFSPVTIDSGDEIIPAVGLGPMAVRPDRQRQGIGGRLVEEGLNLLKKEGHNIIVVLGHAEYYPRFGFTPAVNSGLACAYDAPPEAFMVKELTEGSLENVSGTVHYHQAFDEA